MPSNECPLSRVAHPKRRIAVTLMWEASKYVVDDVFPYQSFLNFTELYCHHMSSDEPWIKS